MAGAPAEGAELSHLCFRLGQEEEDQPWEEGEGGEEGEEGVGRGKGKRDTNIYQKYDKPSSLWRDARIG